MEKVEIVLDYPKEVLFEAVVSQASRALTESIQCELEGEVRKRVTKAVDDQINSIVAGVLEKAFTPVDCFGEPSGAATTVKAILTKKAETFLAEKVDSSGRAADRNSYGVVATRSEWIVGKLFAEAIDSKAQVEIKALADQAKAKAHLEVAKLLVAQITKG